MVMNEILEAKTNKKEKNKSSALLRWQPQTFSVLIEMSVGV